jgi:futalosine hydrolase
MKILIVVATYQEIEPLLTATKVEYSPNIYLYAFPQGTHQLDILITGIGMIHTCYHLTRALALCKYELVINAGIAGSFRKKFKNGQIVHVTSEIFSDLSVEHQDKTTSLFEEKLLDKNQFPFKNGELKNEGWKTLNPDLLNFPAVRGITVNTVHGKKKTIQKIRKKFSPDVESMEGGAVFMVCLFERINFIEIRSISNAIEPRNTRNWNIKLAIKSLNLELIHLLKNIS